MIRPCINDYLDKHKSQYIGKYRCHSMVQTKKYEHKFRYYILDSQFREINVFLTLDYSHDEIEYNFSVSLHEQEEEYIIKDALQKIIDVNEYPSILHCHIFEYYIESHPTRGQPLEPVDYRNILDYLEYHRGTNQEAVDSFYDFFIPYLQLLLKMKSYHKFMVSIELLLDKILYEYEWEGTNTKFLDTQYQYHLYNFRKIIRMVYDNIDSFYKETKDELMLTCYRIVRFERFTFAIMTDFGTLVMSRPKILKELLKYCEEKVEENNENNIVLPYLKAVFLSDKDAFREANLDVIRRVMLDILTFANHDLELAIGNSIIHNEGYDLLIELFKQDYNTFVFVCFQIDTFPKKYLPIIKEELEVAIKFYAARMDNEEYRLSSFEQVANINRLLMENFGGYK
ncbi:MAG: hypothetical protein PHH04_06620 [Thomasclavelia sp.]|nr:hypothetical protein [Thomasclavelia sp.]